MNIEKFREYCLLKKGVTEEFPFDDVTLVFKVMGKIFALTKLNKEFKINLKCDTEQAMELREKYPAVQPGYHMNKLHWNTIMIDDSVPDKLIYQWINHSYNLVIEKLTKAQKKELPYQ